MIVSIKAVKTEVIGKLKIDKSFTGPDDVNDIVTDALNQIVQGEEREHFIVVAVNTKNKPTALYTASIGTLNQTLVHPREVFRFAILEGAAGIIIAHNHPSGDCSPSQEDIALTRRMVDAGNILGIKVIDHLIVGNGYSSFRNLSLM